LGYKRNTRQAWPLKQQAASFLVQREAVEVCQRLSRDDHRVVGAEKHFGTSVSTHVRDQCCRITLIGLEMSTNPTPTGYWSIA